MIATLLAAIIPLFPIVSRGADDSPDAKSDFSRGVSLFKEGKLEEARTAFHAALQAEPYNTDLLYNLGLVELKRERYGWALGFWREALRLDPWHFRSREALDWAKTKLRHAELPRQYSIWDLIEIRILAWVTLPQLFFLTSICFLFSGWLSLRWLGLRRRAIQADEPNPPLPVPAALTTLGFIVAATLLAGKALETSYPRATVVVEKAEARSANDPASTVLFILSEGHEVLIRRTEGEWTQVTYPGGPTGWISNQSLYQGIRP